MTIFVLRLPGIIINVKKSDLAQTQELVYIGDLSLTDAWTGTPPFRQESSAVVSFNCVGVLHITRLWMQVLGLMAIIPCIPEARY